MKNKPIGFGVLFLIAIIACSFSSNNRTFQTECVSLETDGYLTIKIWDTKKGANYKIEQARKDAVSALLFSGIAGANGCATQPPILNKLEEQEKFKIIEKRFFSKKGPWIKFSRSANLETNLPTNYGSDNGKVFQITISRNELRKYLEEMKIIKPLNYGF